MAKFFLLALALVGLVGAASMQDASPSVSPSQPAPASNGLLGGLGNLLNSPNGGGQGGLNLPQLPQLPQLNQLLGGGSQQMQQQQQMQQRPYSGGVFDTLRDLPQRGLQMINSLMSNVRSMLGRQQQQPMRNPMNGMMGQMGANTNGAPMLNMPNPFASNNMQQQPQQQQQGPLGALSNTLTPLTDSLSRQTGLPLNNLPLNNLMQSVDGLTRPLLNQANTN